MSTTTYNNPDGSKSTIVIPDPIVTVAPPIVTQDDPVYSWTPAPPVPAVAKPVRTLIGGTPRGKSDAPGVAAVDAAYGAASVIRLYCTGTLIPPVPTGRKVVGSFKTLPGRPLEANEYDWLFYQHEIDAKVKKGTITLAQWQSDMAALKKTGITNLGVCVTADAFVNPSKPDPSTWLTPGVTHIGVDFDGISSATGYHDYTKELAAVVAFCAKHGLTWGVPEFGANRAANDPDGSGRAAWLVHWIQQFQRAGAQYVCLWEQDSQVGSTFTTPVEIATVRTMFALAS